MSRVALDDFDCQVGSDLDLTGEGTLATAANHPTLVVRAGVLSPGRSYTFSMTATDLFGSTGYSGKCSAPTTLSLCYVLGGRLRRGTWLIVFCLTVIR